MADGAEMTKSKTDKGKAAKAPAATLVATETFRGTLDDGQEVTVYANATTAKASDPVAKKWPALFKPLA
jgi:hypothetical protein